MPIIAARLPRAAVGFAHPACSRSFRRVGDNPPSSMMSKFLVTAIVALLLAISGAHAQQYPVKPVRVLIPFPPAGPTDIIGRMVADILTKTYGVQFVADNRAGAGGNIGTELCAKSPPDGYTI